MFIANNKESLESREPKVTLQSFVEKAIVFENDETLFYDTVSLLYSAQ